VAADIATLSNTQTLTGDKTFSGTNTFSGTDTFTTIPAFNGGTSGATAPFTVDSTQIVTNLNADLLDGLSSTDYLRTSASNIISSGSLRLDNNVKFYAGTSSDFSIYFDGGSNSYIETTSGNIVTKVKSNSSYFRVATYSSVGAEFDGITVGGPTPFVRLYYGGVEQLRTNAGGPTVNATPSIGDDSLKIATTAFVQAAKPFRGALAYSIANQSINSGVGTIIALGGESYDTDSIHNNVTSNSRVVVPSGVTKVRLTGQIQFDTNTTGRRAGWISSNLSTYAGQPIIEIPAATAAGTVNTTVPLSSAIVSVSGGDYFYLTGVQESGGALNVEPGTSGSGTWLAMEIIE